MAPTGSSYEHRSTEIAAIAGLPARAHLSSDPAWSHQRQVRYIEDKHVDWARVQQILSLSERARQWANGGPVALALERALEHVLDLPQDRAVVVCASATAGLQALAGLHALKRGRALRWVVCDYTFFCQHTGPFADAILVDCSEAGLIDLAAVAALPDEAWDGLVVTNLFASLADVSAFTTFCRARGKMLIVDSAAALFGPDRRSGDQPAEAISFHHTKPWGLGEGGCVIIDRDDVPVIRAAINFGAGAPDLLKRFAGNGKISDIACAPILDRLEQLAIWAPAYRAQRERIEALCAVAGVPVLANAPRRAVLASVPALARTPVQRDDLAGRSFDVGKYYPPLGTGPVAHRLFARIVNIPAHADMAAIESDAIADLLRVMAQ